MGYVTELPSLSILDGVCSIEGACIIGGVEFGSSRKTAALTITQCPDFPHLGLITIRYAPAPLEDRHRDFEGRLEAAQKRLALRPTPWRLD